MIAMNDENINSDFASWAKGHGVISHSIETQQRIQALAEQLLLQKRIHNVDDLSLIHI